MFNAQNTMPEAKLVISETEANIIDALADNVRNAKYGIITNWDEPYGISFKEFEKQVDIIKYGKEYVDKRENEEIKRRLEEEY